MCEATERQGNCMRHSRKARPMGVIHCRSRYGLCCRSSRSQWHASGLARWIASAHTICPSPTVTAQGATHRHAMTQAPPIPSFPHQQAEKSRHNHHVASIPHGGTRRLQHRLARTSKPKRSHATTTLCPSSTVAPTALNTDLPAPAKRNAPRNHFVVSVDQSTKRVARGPRQATCHPTAPTRGPTGLSPSPTR